MVDPKTWKWTPPEGFSCQDVMEFLRSLPDGSVDLVCCDPPYGISFLQGAGGWDDPRTKSPEWDKGEHGRRLKKAAGGVKALGNEKGLRLRMGALLEYPKGPKPGRRVRPSGTGDISKFGYTDGANRISGVTYGSSRNPTCRTCGKRERGKERCACVVPDTDRVDWGIETFKRFSAWCEAWSRECLRVLRPGGFLLAMGGRRTWDALAWGIRMAGFEVRDTITWVNGQGMAQGQSIGKAFDKVAGVKRTKKIGRYTTPDRGGLTNAKGEFADAHVVPNGPTGSRFESLNLYAPATSDGERWEGYNSALRGAVEFVVVARKPFPGTMTKNLREHGVGALDIESSRIPAAGKPPGWLKTGTVGSKAAEGFVGTRGFQLRGSAGHGRTPEEVAHVGEAHERAGRWPTNYAMVHSDACVKVGVSAIKGIIGTSGRKGGVLPMYNSLVGDGSRVGYVDADGKEAVDEWICVGGCPVKLASEVWAPTKSGVIKAGQVRKISMGKGFCGTSTFAHGSVAARRTSPGDEGSPVRFFVLPGQGGAGLVHAEGCKQVENLKAQRPFGPKSKSKGVGGRGGVLLAKAGGYHTPGRKTHDGVRNYGDAASTTWDCVADCPVAQARKDAALLDVGFYSGKVHPPARRLPGYLTILPKDPQKPESVGVDEGVAAALCARWGIPQGAGESWLETLLGWPIPEEVVPPEEASLFQPGMSLHPTVKPLSMARWATRCFSPRPETVARPVVVVDPFGGSGSIPLAAAQEGRAAVYNDFTPRYTAVAAVRFEAVGLKPTLASDLRAPSPREWGGVAVRAPKTPIGLVLGVKACPKCGVEGDVGTFFGYRSMKTPKGHVVRAQSWCRPCRGKKGEALAEAD